jgi:hypothetical protein
MDRFVVASWLVASLGCWNYRSQLDRAEEHYRSGRYSEAMANLDDLEPSLSELNPADRARYGYVRGMSHARLGQRADARHWLAVTREMVEANAPLPETDRRELLRALVETDWILPADTAPHAPTLAVPSGTEPLDSAPPSPAARGGSPRE